MIIAGTQAQQEMNRVLCDVQTLQMKNQQELFSLLQSRLERVSQSITVPHSIAIHTHRGLCEPITEAALLLRYHLTMNIARRRSNEGPG